MRRSRAALVFVLALTACSRTELALLQSTPVESNDTGEPSADAAIDVTVVHPDDAGTSTAADAGIDAGIESESDAALDAPPEAASDSPADSPPEADVLDATTCIVVTADDHANWHPSDSPSSLVDNGDGTITDDNTGLTWLQAPVGETIDGGGTPLYPGSLAAAEALCPCPWRVPSRSELLSIIDYSRFDMALSPLFVAPAKDAPFAWTSTPFEASGSEWFVGLVEGIPSGPIQTSDADEVRCVRGTTQPPAVRYTLQTSDGGVAEVVDNGTGLTWKQESEPGTYTLLNTACEAPYRLPTISELHTLVDSTRSHPAIDVTFFSDTGSDFYPTQSGVASPYLLGYFWYVDFTSGTADYADYATWGSTYQVRCVR